MLRPRVQSFRDVHQQPAEKEQSQEREAHDDGKGGPVIFCRESILQIIDLRREIAGQEANW